MLCGTGPILSYASWLGEQHLRDSRPGEDNLWSGNTTYGLLLFSSNALVGKFV